MIHPLRLSQLKAHIPYLFRPGSLLNIGANRVRFELLPELHQAKREITLLEVWPANAAHWRGDKRLRSVIEGDVRQVDKLDLGTFDTVLWWHGPEHINRSDLVKTLAKLEQMAEGLIVLGCPWGIYPQGEFMGNPHEIHQSALYPADFEVMGYQTATLGEADRQGSLIAWKYLRGANARRDAGAQIPHVVMVTHGSRAHYLYRTIPAVLRTTWPLTLTVVADAPGEEATDYLESQRPRLWALRICRQKTGKPKAANLGWRLRDADHTVLLDDDALARDPDWLRKLIDIAEKCPEVGIVGHSMESTDWPLRVLGRPARTVQVQPGNLGGACILIPRRTVETCGYYNEELPAYGESDGLYGWKVHRSGKLCAYFDHSDLGRSFEHLGEQEPDEAYRRWKAVMRAEALVIEKRLIEEYEAGRPLNT